MARVTHTVGDQEVLFKAIPIRTIMSLRTFTKGTEAVSKLASKWINSKTEVTSEAEHFTEYHEDGTVSRAHSITKPIDPQIAAKNQRELEVGFKNIIELFFSPEAEDLLSRVIAETALDYTPFDGKSKEEKEAWVMDEADPGEVLELVTGSLKATRGIADVLGKLFGLKQDTVSLIKGQVQKIVDKTT